MSSRYIATSRLLAGIREFILQAANLDSLRRFISRECPGGKTLVFLVLTREVVHMAPLAVALRSASFQPVFLLNGVPPPDQAWLRDMVGDVPMFRLRTSLKGNPRTLLEHGTILQYLISANRSSFCIQDPDLFITDQAFFDTMSLDNRLHYAAGPYAKDVFRHSFQIPDTFILWLNAPLLRQLQARFDLNAKATNQVPRGALEILKKAGFSGDQYPEESKAYYDTLQMFWVVAHALGSRFNLIPGAEKSVFHIGGSSYLWRETSDLSRGDFWPLNVHYFNLKLLSLAKCERFRERFSHLFKTYGTPEALLAQFPAYRQVHRFAKVCHILERLQADRVYA